MTSPVSIPAGHELVAADFDAYENLTASWIDYSSSLSWTAASSNPAIGNGTIVAEYMQAGQLVIYRGRIAMGSTTTFGSGVWSVSLPVTSSTGSLGCGAAHVFDSGTTQLVAITRLATTTTLDFTGTSGAITATSPITWTTNDVLRWAIIYEAA